MGDLRKACTSTVQALGLSALLPYPCFLRLTQDGGVATCKSRTWPEAGAANTASHDKRALLPTRQSRQIESRRKLLALDVGHNTLEFFGTEDALPWRHLTKAVGDTVINKIRFHFCGIQLGCFARICAVAVAVSALVEPNPWPLVMFWALPM